MKKSFATINCLIWLAFFQCFQAAWAMSPTDRDMILLSVTGTRWGAMQAAFTAHAFSLKTTIGRAIWHDSAPNTIELVNPENASHIVIPLSQYIEDISSHSRRRRESGSSVKSVSLADGHKARETTLFAEGQSGQRQILQKTVSLDDVTLPKALNEAWCYIMANPPSSGFVVALASSKGHRHRDSAAVGSPKNLVEYQSVKLVPVQKDRFTVPKSYKLASDSATFYLSPGGESLKKEDIDDLFRSSAR
ncbi:MAG: hypothetical protein JSS83_01140 [Cyanobacteria bacterium SZAS LIN-3]|nr:hypothetical protein [Cyanobacteria bacterium SZAS LIN-3]MBS2009107.1 hypothetical protein [Cyanobacteria bacterium SZAS TMP-1]